MKKIGTYKGFVIASSNDGLYHLFTKDEWQYGEGFRTEEMEVGSIQEAYDFINSY